MRSALLLALASFDVSGAHAQDHPLVGVWKLVSYDLELKDGGPRQKVWGENPSGYISFTAKGRVMVVIEAADRNSYTIAEDGERLLLSTAAYSGTYRLEGNAWITSVDVAWLPSQRGEQRREYQIDGDLLSVTTPWIKDPRLPNQPETRSILIWQKVE